MAFFFQAEDGIRDGHVTGVQTCALPISERVATLPQGVTAAQAETAAVEGFSRFPVMAADGTLVGYVHIKDLLEAAADARDEPIPSARIRELTRIGSEQTLRAALKRLQATGAHLDAATD